MIDGEVEVYTEPEALGYATSRVFRRGDSIRLVAFPDLAVAVSDIVARKLAR